MALRFYIDTCIWRDYLEERSDGMNDLGQIALHFIENCLTHHAAILYSQLVGEELKNAQLDCFDEIKRLMGKNLLEISISENQLNEAKQLAQQKKISKNDAIHAIFARNNNAILITRDVDFEELSTITKWEKPENISFSLL